MNSRFFTFLDPFLRYIDNGKFFREPFRWVYAIIAVLNLLVPLAVLGMAIGNDVFEYANARMIFAFIFVLLILALAAWFSFMIWWNRKSKLKLTTEPGDDFIAIPVFSHFVQTLGEWMGVYVGVVGFLLSIVMMIFLGRYGEGFAEAMGLGALVSGGFFSALLMPVYGFIIVVVARVLAEIYRALAAIANNTKKN